MSGGVVMWKTFPVWITFIGKKLDFVKMSGELCMGDNLFGGFWVPHSLPLSPTISTEFMAGCSVMTTFSPLTIAGRPYFYYIYFLAKKGLLSVRSRE